MRQMNNQSKPFAPLRRSAAFLLPLLLVLILLSLLFEPKNNTAAAGIQKAKIMASGFLAEPENTLDVLIIGDSETYSAFSPMQMWEEQGITSYVCGSPGQTLLESRRFLKQALRTQSPKAVVLETDVVFQRVYPQQMVYDAVSNPLGVFRYHDRWKNLHRSDFYQPPKYTNLSFSKGFLIRWRHVPVEEEQLAQYMRRDEDTWQLRPSTRWNLSRFFRLCQSEGIPVLLVSSPSPKNWDYQKHNCMQRIADRRGLAYLDLNLHSEELGINWSKDSIDGGDHLNMRGARKATAYLGQWLKEQAELPDRRTDPACSQWAQLLEQYNRTIGKSKAHSTPTQHLRSMTDALAQRFSDTLS